MKPTTQPVKNSDALEILNPHGSDETNDLNLLANFSPEFLTHTVQMKQKHALINFLALLKNS